MSERLSDRYARQADEARAAIAELPQWMRDNLTPTTVEVESTRRPHESPWGDTREWYTPPELFERLGIRFHLDPASPMSGPVPWVTADRFYSPRENGLVQEWVGCVWLNPPYGPPGVAFIDKMIAHGDGALLIPARTETRVFQRAAEAADVVVFLRDRLHFIRADGFRGRAAFASVLMAFGPHCKYDVIAADLGWTVVK